MAPPVSTHPSPSPVTYPVLARYLPGTYPVHVLGRAVRKRCVRWQRRIPRDRGQ